MQNRLMLRHGATPAAIVAFVFASQALIAPLAAIIFLWRASPLALHTDEAKAVRDSISKSLRPRAVAVSLAAMAADTATMFLTQRAYLSAPNGGVVDATVASDSLIMSFMVALWNGKLPSRSLVVGILGQVLGLLSFVLGTGKRRRRS